MKLALLKTLVFTGTVIIIFAAGGCQSRSSHERQLVDDMIAQAVKAQKQRTLFNWFEIRENRHIDWVETYRNYDTLYSTASIEMVRRVTEDNLGAPEATTLEYFKRALVSDHIDARLIAIRQKKRRSFSPYGKREQ